MILLPSQWHDFYNGIREDQHTTTEKKISIFVNGTDCDSLCALKLLQAILMASQTSCSTFIVSTLRDLKDALCQEFGKGVRDYRTAFCINCGATASTGELLEQLDATARECVRLVFIDSHRPIHHSLNDDQDQTCVILHQPDGGDVPVDSIPLADSFFVGNENRDSRRRRTSEAGDHVSGESSEREAEMAAYYQRGSHYGIPASMILFHLAHEMQLGGNYLLWMASLGLTEQFLLRRALPSTPHYVYCLEQLENHTEALAAGERQQGLFGEGFESDDEEEIAAAIGAGPPSAKCAQGRIMRSNEAMLLLYRHWSLVDAMTHTPELMSRLRTYREGVSGKAVLLTVLAKSGIPVQQAQLQYSQMKVQYKTEEAMADILYCLQELMPNYSAQSWHSTYRSFAVEFTSKLTLSAADHVHAVWALLAYGAQQADARLDQGFWDAYKATDIRSKFVVKGLSLAKAQHRQMLVDVAMADPTNTMCDTIIMEQPSSPGQILDLSKHPSWAASSPLVHPVSLIRFGMVLQDADAAWMVSNSEWRHRPLICVGPPHKDGMCSAAALSGHRKVQKHPVTKEVLFCSHNGYFNAYGGQGGLIAAALQATGVNSVCSDFFDSSIFTLHKDDSDNFCLWLSEAWHDRESKVWSREGVKGLLGQ